MPLGKILAPIMIILTLFAPTILALTLPKPSLEAPNIKGELEVRINGEIVYRSHDVITYHWVTAMLATFLHDKHSSYNWIDEEGNSHSSPIGTEYYEGNPKPYIEIGNGSQQETPSVYRLASLLKREEASDYDYFFSNGAHVVKIYGYFVIESNTTVSEVGFSINAKYRSFNFYLLVAYNALPQPITVPSNSTLTITYTFTIPSKLPFTNNFYTAIIAYGLGLKYLSAKIGKPLPSSLVIKDVNGEAVWIDTGIMWHDYGYHTNNDFGVYAALAEENVPESPLVYTFKKTGFTVPKGSLSYSLDYSTTIYSGRASWWIPSSSTIYGVGFFLYADKNTGGCPSCVEMTYILMAFLPLGEERVVPGHSGVAVGFTIRLYCS